MSFRSAIPELPRLRRQWLSTLWLHYAVMAAVGWLFAAGLVAGGWRLLGLPLPGWLWFGLAGLLLLAVAACLWPARRHLPRSLQAVALLDDSNNAGGLLCALADGADANAWKAPEAAQLPCLRLDWRPRRRMLALGLLFFLGCLLVPVPEGQARQPTLNISRKVDALEKQIDLLAANGLLEKQEAEEMKKGLEELEEKASGLDPVKTLEQLDYEKQALENKELESLQGGSQMAEALKEAEAGLRAMAGMNADKTMSAEEQLKGLQELEKMLMAAQAKNGMPMTPAMREAMEKMKQTIEELEKQAGAQAGGTPGQEGGGGGGLQGMMTPELMNKLADAMRQAGTDVRQKLQDYAKGQQGMEGGGAMDPQALQEMLDRLNGMTAEEIAEEMRKMAEQMQQQGGQGQEGEGGQGQQGGQGGMSAGMMMFNLEQGGMGMAGNQGEQGQGQGQGQGGEGQDGSGQSGSNASGSPGSGGITRGRGDAALTFGQEQQASGKGQRQILPGARIRDLENSQTAGYSWAAPGESAAGKGEASGTDALRGTRAGAANTRPPQVLPRHQKAVEQYFERK